jgi:hypothetical protein
VFADVEGVVLGIDTERVETHGLEDPSAAHALITAKGVKAAVLEDVTDVQSLR